MLSHFNGGKIVRNPLWKPYYYQTEAVEKTEEKAREGWGKPLIVMPTGSGKTKSTGELCARVIEKGERALFLGHTKELVRQPARAFEDDFGCSATIEMANQKADDSLMVFASVATMANRIKDGKWRPDTFKRVIMDEAHHSLSATHSLVADFFGQGGALIVGCTATPRRGDRKDLLKFFDGISYDKKIEDLFREGFLIEPTIRLEPLGITVRQEKPGDMSDEEVGEAIEPYLEEAAERIMKYAKGRCGLSFLPLRRTARMFRDILIAKGLKCEYVGGDVDEKEQKQIKYRLEMGQIDHVCNAQLFSEGVDIRPLDLLVDLRPTLSWTAAMQKWGRLTRTFDPSSPYASKLKGTRWGLKKDSILVDFCFESERHSMVQRPAVMVARDDDEAAQITRIIAKGGGGNLMDAVKSATNEREETLRRRLEAMRSRQSREVSALDFFLGQKRMDMVEYTPESKWEIQPITDAQAATIARAGIDLNSVQGKGHASKVIDSLAERIKKNMATIPQARFCESLGHKDPWNLTFEEARRWLDLNNRRKK